MGEWRDFLILFSVQIFLVGSCYRAYDSPAIFIVFVIVYIIVFADHVTFWIIVKYIQNGVCLKRVYILVHNRNVTISATNLF